ncbi:alanine racemase [Undibacterium arcticum]|uniref:Alanine racemase n=1 Tax=Undibacterium arcticum TaxID=1762892 RepID=A0ABV7FAW3_9BURK
MKPTKTSSGATLSIDLGAIRQNYRLLRRQAGKAACAAVMKADAYGLGASHIAPILAQEGCRHFFVAHLDEGIGLRRCVPAEADIFVLHGPPPEAERDFIEHGLIPVLNSLPQVRAWRTLCQQLDRRLPAVIQVDTGMSRMGLSPDEVDILLSDANYLHCIDLRYLMSHLACAESQSHFMNEAQLRRFQVLRARFPSIPASLANSSGIFLGRPYQFDLVRPGAALYGLAPVAGEPNPMHPVVSLQGRIIQTRTIKIGDYVGYGLTYRADSARHIATVSVGYADGWMRAMSNRGIAVIGGVSVPFVGSVSMDTITLDVTAIDRTKLVPGAMVDLIGPNHPVDTVAALARTIGYEILTSLGNRFHREYVDAPCNCDDPLAGAAASSSIAGEAVAHW